MEYVQSVKKLQSYVKLYLNLRQRVKFDSCRIEFLIISETFFFNLNIVQFMNDDDSISCHLFRHLCIVACNTVLTSMDCPKIYM